MAQPHHPLLSSHLLHAAPGAALVIVWGCLIVPIVCRMRWPIVLQPRAGAEAQPGLEAPGAALVSHTGPSARDSAGSRCVGMLRWVGRSLVLAAVLRGCGTSRAGWAFTARTHTGLTLRKTELGTGQTVLSCCEGQGPP